MIDQSTFDFLADLKMNNRREWYHANKGRFKDAQQNFIDFVAMLLFRISEFDAEMIEKSQANLSDVDGFTEFVRTIQGVEVAFMIQEVSPHSHRINFRSSGNYIINDVAKEFGGGGHIYAAGAHVDGLTVKEIEKNILEQLMKKINNGN